MREEDDRGKYTHNDELIGKWESVDQD